MKNQTETINKVLHYIEENIENELNMDKIANHAGYSKFYLNRIFLETTGITIYKYLQGRRLTLAAEKLVNSNLSIIEIAYEAGYDSQQSFSLAFKKHYLYPPNLYRSIGVFTPRQNRITLNRISHVKQDVTVRFNTCYKMMEVAA